MTQVSILVGKADRNYTKVERVKVGKQTQTKCNGTQQSQSKQKEVKTERENERENEKIHQDTTFPLTTKKLPQELNSLARLTTRKKSYFV